MMEVADGEGTGGRGNRRWGREGGEGSGREGSEEGRGGLHEVAYNKRVPRKVRHMHARSVNHSAPHSH